MSVRTGALQLDLNLPVLDRGSTSRVSGAGGGPAFTAPVVS